MTSVFTNEDLTTFKELLKLENETNLRRFVGNIPFKAKAKVLSQNLDDNGWTALHYAVKYKNIPAAAFLIAEGVDVNIQDKIKGRNPLHLAVLFNKNDSSATTILTWLLKQDGIDVNAPDREDRRTPLHFAVMERDESAVAQLLASKYIKPYIADKGLELPLHVACSRWYTPAIVELLLNDIWKRKDPSFISNKTCTPLHYAASEGHSDLVSRLLSHKAYTALRFLHIDQVDKQGEAALFKADASRHYRVCQILTKHQASLGVVPSEKMDALLDTVEGNGYTDVFKLLLSHRTDNPTKNSAEAIRRTTLSLNNACCGGSLEIVRWIMDKCWIDMNAYEDKPNFLSLAKTAGQKQVVKYIIEESFLWYEALCHHFLNESKIRDSPMRQLVRTMPDVAKTALNKCVEVSQQRVRYYYDYCESQSVTTLACNGHRIILINGTVNIKGQSPTCQNYAIKRLEEYRTARTHAWCTTIMFCR